MGGPSAARAQDPAFGFEAPDLLFSGDDAPVSVSFSQDVLPTHITVTVTGAGRFGAFTPLSCPNSPQLGVCAMSTSGSALLEFTVQTAGAGDYTVALHASTPSGEDRLLGTFTRTVLGRPGRGQIALAPTTGDFGHVLNAEVSAPLDRAGIVQLPAVVRASGPVRIAMLSPSGRLATFTLSDGDATLSRSAGGLLTATPACRGRAAAHAAKRRKRRRHFGTGGTYHYADVQRRPGSSNPSAATIYPASPPPPTLGQSFARYARRLPSVAGPLDLSGDEAFNVSAPGRLVVHGYRGAQVLYGSDCRGNTLLAASSAWLTVGTGPAARVTDAKHEESPPIARRSRRGFSYYRLRDQILHVTGR